MYILLHIWCILSKRQMARPATNWKIPLCGTVGWRSSLIFGIPAPMIEVWNSVIRFFVWAVTKLFCDQRVITFFVWAVTKKCDRSQNYFVIARQMQLPPILHVTYHDPIILHHVIVHPTIKPIGSRQPKTRTFIRSLASLLFCGANPTK